MSIWSHSLHKSIDLHMWPCWLAQCCHMKWAICPLIPGGTAYFLWLPVRIRWAGEWKVSICWGVMEYKTSPCSKGSPYCVTKGGCHYEKMLLACFWLHCIPNLWPEDYEFRTKYICIYNSWMNVTSICPAVIFWSYFVWYIDFLWLSTPYNGHNALFY